MADIIDTLGVPVPENERDFDPTKHRGEKRRYAETEPKPIKVELQDTGTKKGRAVSGQYDWQKKRIKASGIFPGSSLVSGYGQNGELSMYIPSPIAKRNYRFINGKPVVEMSSDLNKFPEISDLRQRVLSSGSAHPQSIEFPDTVLLEYSAAILSLTYDLSDEDLSLLHSGMKWMEKIIVHAMGGESNLSALLKINTDPIRNMAIDVQQAVTAATIPSDSKEYREIEKAIEVGEYITDDSLEASDDSDFDISRD